MQGLRFVVGLALASSRLAGVPAWATVPPTINIQGQVLDGAGGPAVGPIDLQIEIWDSATEGVPVYAERHLATPLTGGVFNVLLGNGTEQTGTLTPDTFTSADRWLELRIDGETLAPRQPFAAVPYALHAANADRAASAADADQAAHATDADRATHATEADLARGVTVRNESGAARTSIGLTSQGAGQIETWGPAGQLAVRLMTAGDAPDNGYVAVYDAAGIPRVNLFVNASNRAVAAVAAEDGSTRTYMTTLSSGAGFLATVGPNGKDNVRLSTAGDNPNLGFLEVVDANGNARVASFVGSSGAGTVITRGPAGRAAVMLSTLTAAPDNGYLSVFDASGNARAAIYADQAGAATVGVLGATGAPAVLISEAPSGGSISTRAATGGGSVLQSLLATGEGFVATFGPNGKLNTSLDSMGGSGANNGHIAAYDAAGVEKASLQVNAAGRGQIVADVKNFVVDYPDRPGTQIVYASIEGPEVAMYNRGAVRLIDGRATIELPDHFRVLAVPDTVTVQLTPRSFGSAGVGFEILDDLRIEVGELGGGHGSYDVHYVVCAVRRGYENHQPVVTTSAARADRLLGTGAAHMETAAAPALAPPVPDITRATGARE